MFKKYSKIINSYDTEFLDKVREVVPKNEIWCVTEKLHGTNFSLLKDGKFGRKSNILKEDENFYNYQEYKETLVEIANRTFEKIPKAVQIYGEFFGPGIQKGVDYGTEKQFKIFDVRLANSTFVSSYNLYSLLKDTVPYLTSGPLEHCLNYPNDKISTINPSKDNIMEGVVIRPLFQDFYTKYGERCIIKSKNNKFAEKQRAKRIKPSKELTQEETTQLQSLSQYATKGRINNVRSHLNESPRSENDTKNFNKILGLTIQDILEETKIETTKQVKKELGKVLAPILRDILFYTN